ncbi:hypothetical protein Pcinc_019342 [Petrolisthes cinctipes]|uniref:Receptor-interacting serine-threonine kinase 4 n=1 Tax=Petrolisthes cinctipes TaxID=88211 RepID=A0AAE1FL61_PETCI|nr:hypothetical protein Pcinc_019342 [Petrolisthes cinctipes]
MALHLASAKGHITKALELLQNGTSVNARDDTGRRPLHLAATTGQHTLIPVLLENGAMMEAQDKQGIRAVHLAAVGGHLETLVVLEKHGCHLPAVCDNSKSTSLHLAAEKGHLDVVKWLVEQGLSITAKDINRLIPQQRAEDTHQHHVADFLHKLAVSDQTQLPPPIADRFRVQANKKDRKRLPRRQSDPLRNNKEQIGPADIPRGAVGGRRVVSAADTNKHFNSADDESLLEAAADGDLQAVMEALRDGAHLEVSSTRKGEEGLRAVHLAAWGGYADVVGHLLEAGARSEVVADGRRPVHWAAAGGHVGVLKVLHKYGCQLNALTAVSKWTTLHLAADQGNLEVVRWLVEKGQLDTQATSVNDSTPEQLAKAAHNTDIVNYLRSRQT